MKFSKFLKKKVKKKSQNETKNRLLSLNPSPQKATDIYSITYKKQTFNLTKFHSECRQFFQLYPDFFKVPNFLWEVYFHNSGVISNFIEHVVFKEHLNLKVVLEDPEFYSFERNLLDFWRG